MDSDNSTSSPSSLKSINSQIANEEGYFDSCDTAFGHFWVSRHRLKSREIYTSSPPPGVHLGAGISTLRTRLGSKVEQCCNGPVLTLLVMPETVPVAFETTIEAGEQLSCGLHIPFKTLKHEPMLATHLSEHINPQKMLFRIIPSANELVHSLCDSTHFWQDQSSFDVAMHARATNLTALILMELNQATAPLPEYILNKVSQARRIILEQFSRPLTISSIALQVGMSVRALSGHYKTYFGMTINDSLCSVRMKQAIHLLRAGKTVTETAYLVGYSSNHFSTKFRQVYGFPPCDLIHKSLPDPKAVLPESE